MRQPAISCALLALAGLGACAAPPSPSASALPTQSPSAAAASEPSDTPRPTDTPLPVVSAEPFAAGEAMCRNEAQGYAVSYPADWTVAPADPEQEIAACHFFGPGPLDLDFSDGEGVPPTIDVGAASGACLEFIAGGTADLEDVTVADYPAIRAEDGSGDYWYILNLRHDDGPVLVEPNDPTPPTSDECRGAHWLMIAGRDWGAIDGLPLRRIVDRMATTIEILDD